MQFRNILGTGDPNDVRSLPFYCRDGRVGVYVTSADGTEVSKLTDTPEEACCAAWQPVGS